MDLDFVDGHSTEDTASEMSFVPQWIGNVLDYTKSLSIACYRRLLGRGPVEVVDHDAVAKAAEETRQLAHREAELSIERALQYTLQQLKPPPRHHKQILSLDRRQFAAQAINAPGSRVETLVEYGNIPVSRDNLQTLRETSWLNDEIINVYMALLLERNARQRQRYKEKSTLGWLPVPNPDLPPSNHEGDYDPPECYFWNTFFFAKLSGDRDLSSDAYDFNAVKRWTTRKKVNLFEKDFVVVPVHVNQMHWACGVVDMNRQKMYFFDSLSGGSSAAFGAKMKRYLQDEHVAKLNRNLPENHPHAWEVTTPPCPQQQNCSDCGVFTCCVAECIGDGRWQPNGIGGGVFDFDQTMIPDRRLLMVWQILNGHVD